MIAVIVPAHNEADHITMCVQSIKCATAHEDLKQEPVLIIVIADACTDDTGVVAARLGAQVITVSARNVGVARRDGASYALERGARWLAFTDADTIVSPDWLVQQLSCHSDAVCGVVAVSDWSEHSDAVRVAYASKHCDYDGHSHIHGANLGVSAAAYRRVGGFQPLETSEDVALVEALRANGEKIAWSAASRVVTSARLSFKAPAGFGATLVKTANQCRGLSMQSMVEDSVPFESAVV